MAELRVVDEPAVAAADFIAAAVQIGGHIALAGGSTPRAAYERVAEMDLDWSGATLWFGDERCVPQDDERSNYRMVKEALLDRIEGEGPTVKRMPGEMGPHGGAEDYERALQETLGEQLPRLDLVLLGLGPDAHTASLFPTQPAVAVTDRAAVGVERAGMDPQVPRITLTIPAINAARQRVFLISGSDKADAVRRAFHEAPSEDAPASLVQDPVVLLDPPAAAK